MPSAEFQCVCSGVVDFHPVGGVSVFVAPSSAVAGEDFRQYWLQGGCSRVIVGVVGLGSSRQRGQGLQGHPDGQEAKCFHEVFSGVRKRVWRASLLLLDKKLEESRQFGLAQARLQSFRHEGPGQAFKAGYVGAT